MAFGSVRITGPLGRLIYINGNHDEAAGKSPGPFAVEFGRNLFETINGKDEIDYAGKVMITAASPNVELALDRQ